MKPYAVPFLIQVKVNNSQYALLYIRENTCRQYKISKYMSYTKKSFKNAIIMLTAAKIQICVVPVS